jgi:glyoxylase-like metal-dependent hydrolase (beta-lactamase superfamily II)
MSAQQPPDIRRIEGTVMPVNSYIVNGQSGLVVIDGQLTVSDARAVREALDSYGRPVEALLVTHPHPDHYAGAATVLDGLDAPIMTTAAVAEVIERDDAEKDAIVGPMMGDEWPATRRFPDEVVADGELVRAGGLSLQVIEVGPAESHADVLYALEPRRIFSGDVAYSDMHAYLLDGHHRQWLSALERLAGELDPAAELFVGHGKPAGLPLLHRQADYVRAFVDAVSRSRDLGEHERHDSVVATM